MGMTDREKAIVMAYTGAVMLSGDKLGIFYQYIQEKLGYCVLTHELALPGVQNAIADAAKDDFIELAKGNDDPGNGWISVKYRLPPAHDLVIVSINDDHGDNDYRYTDAGWYLTEGKCWIVDNEATINVEAWMPMPKPYEPPKEG